jgi:MEDS: MEthanogen/methylotroph, DcmR Sensory domain
MATTICGHRLDEPTHICAFFDSREEEYSCLVPYFAEGLEQGEQVLSIRDATDHRGHLERLREAEVPVDKAMAVSQFKLMASEETYLKGECFEAERMFAMLNEALESGEKSYTRVRACGEMSWALRNLSGTDQLMEYEARVNQLLPKHDCTLVCVYDVNKFSGRVLLDALSTHPHVVVNGKLLKNPYFVSPLEYLTGRLGRASNALTRDEATT